MSGAWDCVNWPLGPKPYKEKQNIIEPGEHPLWALKFPMACAHSNNTFVKAPTPTQVNTSILANVMNLSSNTIRINLIT